MNPPTGEETIFAEVLRLPPEERAAYLAQSTHGNAELRRRVESLLGSYEAGDFLEQAAATQLRPTLNVTVPLTEKAGDTIGRYKLLQQIGEGGCGVVYMAEQAEPVRRRVALKIIKLGMDTKSVIARFEAERQAVAMMDHPNIAKVFDAGATQTGRPYFVMELVRGMKITDYCDARIFLRVKKNFPEAEKAAREVLAIRRRKSPDGDLRVAHSLQKLALTLDSQSKMTEAEESRLEARVDSDHVSADYSRAFPCLRLTNPQCWGSN